MLLIRCTNCESAARRALERKFHKNGIDICSVQLCGQHKITLTSRLFSNFITFLFTLQVFRETFRMLLFSLLSFYLPLFLLLVFLLFVITVGSEISEA